MKLAIPHSVFVPFEWIGGGLPSGADILWPSSYKWRKRNDIPRFLETAECRQYLETHRLPPVMFFECTEKDLIAEYAAGVGTTAFIRGN